MAELSRLGCVAWATGGTAGVKRLPDGRRIAVRLGQDVLGLFDILAVHSGGVLLAQVKGGARFAGPDRAWRARFAALPHPPHLRYLWAWISPVGWRVWWLLPGGERLEIEWPPKGEAT